MQGDNSIEDFACEIIREAQARKSEIAATAAVNTLYIGGGTPSVLPPAVLGRIADACGGRKYAEWTVEVNPDDITPEYSRELRGLGVNRVSMGVQSLDDGMLRWMNRRHSSDGARKAFRLLREAGFDNISVDIIFGVSGMSDAMLEATVRELLQWRPEHISAYQLSVEEGSALGRMAREGRYTELSDEACAAQYYLICRLLSAAGYDHYEISNWSLPGKRAIHNSAYWVRKPYVGLGPGAHSLRTSVSPGVPPQIPSLRSSLPLRSACGPLPLTCPRVDTGTGAEPPDSTARSCMEARSDDTGDSCVAAQGGTPPCPLGVQGDSSPAAAPRSEGFRSEGSCRDIRSWNSEELSGWTSESEVLTPEQIREEQIMLGLRTAEGIPGYGRIPEDKWFVADDIIAGLI